jgi:type VI protein secretion system component VasF
MSNKTRVVHETKAKRSRRELWKRLFVWAFILLFAFSVAGGVVAISVHR